MRAEDLGQRADGRAGLLRGGAVRQQLGRLGLQGRRAARLQPDDRHPGVQPRLQRGQGPGHDLFGVVELAGADPGQAAADGLGRDLDPVAERLQGGDGVPADARLQVVGERVGPQQQPRPRSLRSLRGLRARSAAGEPRLERFAGQRGNVPFRGDPAEALGHRGQGLAPRGPVQQRGAAGPADQAQPPRQPAQRVVRGRPPPPGVPLGQELSFVRRHVDADGAVPLAALAGQAQVQRAGHVVGVRGVDARPAAGELEQQPGPAAGGVLLLAGGPVARAHHVAAAGQAGPDADAAAGGRLQAAVVVGEGQVRADGGPRSLDVDPHIGVEPAGPDHGPGVHPVPRIPDALELREGGDHRRGVHPRQQLGAGLAVAVLAGQRTAVRRDQVGGLGDEAAEARDTGRGNQVEVDPDVHAAVAEVAVVGAPPAVVVHQLAELPQIRPELLGRHRGVLPAGPGLPAVRAAGEDPRPGLPDAPQGPHRGRVGDDPAGPPGLRGAGRDGLGRRFGFGPGAAAGLDEQPPFAVRQQLVPLIGRPGRPQRGDQRHVHAFDGQRGQVQETGRGVRGPERAGVADDGQHPGGRHGDQIHRGFQHRDAAALGTDQSPGQIEAVLGQQLVQVVTGHPPGQPGRLGADQCGVALAELGQAAIDAARLTGLPRAGGQLIRAGRADGELGAAVADDREVPDVVHGLAPGHRVRAAGVVADHPAQRAAAVRGRVGPEGETVRGGRGAQVVEHHSRLHPGDGLLRVDAQHGPQMPGEVDDHGLVDGLPADAGGRSARQHGHVVLPAHLERGQHVVVVRGLNDPDRDVPVVGRVRGEHGPAGGVEAHLAADPRGQVSGERAGRLGHVFPSGTGSQRSRRLLGVHMRGISAAVRMPRAGRDRRRRLAGAQRRAVVAALVGQHRPPVAAQLLVLVLQLLPRLPLAAQLADVLGRDARTARNYRLFWDGCGPSYSHC